MGTRIVSGDRVLVETATTGTGTYQLGNAVTQHQTPAGAGVPSGARVPYVAWVPGGTEWETGEGVFTAGSPATITRALVLDNHLGTTAAVNWAAGVKYLGLMIPAARLPLLDSDGWYHAAGDLVLATAGTERLRIEADGDWVVADPVKARAGLGAAPASQTAAGIGQIVSISSALGSGLVLPAGGTWEYHATRVTLATGAVTSICTVGIGAGGATVLSGVSGDVWGGRAKRIA